jgi:outer membrane protein assembly factor BamA
LKLIAGILLTILAIPVSAQTLTTASPRIESIDYVGLTDAQQKQVAKRLTVQSGDLLSAEAKQRVARELQATGLELTFSYVPGARYGTARLKISAGC